MKFEVKGKRLLVQEPSKEKVSKSGIIIPDNVSKDILDIKEWFCEILAVGDKIDTDIKVGDICVLDPGLQYAMFLHPDNNKMSMFINQDQIFAIIK